MKAFIRLAVLAIVVLSSAPLQAQTTRTVCASGCNHTTVQAAVNAAALGDTITLKAGETFTGTVTLPVKAGSSFLTIRSDTADANLPPAGVRITPDYAAVLPTVIGSGSGDPTFKMAEGAHHYRLLGLYLPSEPGGFNDILRLGGNACDASGYQEYEADQPTDVEIDRVWIKANAITGQKVGITLGGKRMNVINSRLEGLAALGQDSQAIVGGNGSGPYRIENNYLEAAAENIMFGGADPCQRTVMTVTGTPTTTGASVSVSNHFASGNAHTLAELSVGQLIAVLTNAGTQRRHTIIRSITGSGGTGSITFDPIAAVPDVPGDIRAGVQASNITVRRNYFTKQLRWRSPIIDAVTSASATPSTASGSLAAGSYEYKVVAINTGCYANNTCYSLPQTVTATLNATGNVKIDWQPSPTASHYRIYGRTSTVSMYFQVAVGTNTYTDTGSAGTAATTVPSSSKWQVKNLFELKTGANVNVDSNIFEYHWKGSDQGYSMWLKSTNQSNGHEWGQTRDVVIENNIWQHIDGWVSMQGAEYASGTAADKPADMTNVTFRNNLVIDSNTAWADGGSGVYAIGASSYPGGKIVNLTFDHNTIGHFMRGLVQFSNSTKHVNFVFKNNMARRVSFGFFGTAGGEGTGALENNTASYTVQNNTFAGASANLYVSGASGTMTGNFFPTPAAWEAAFENFTSNGDPDADGPANYALLDTSAYNNAATDGTDIGANVGAILTATATVRNGGAATAFTPPTITTTSPLAQGTVGTPYSVTLQGLGIGTLSWAVQSGTLPTGLTLSAGGVISGTPTVAQTQTVTVRVTDATSSLTADQILALTINASYTAPTVTTTTLANATQGVPYSAQLANTGGLAPFTWSVSSGTLPTGVTLNAETGLLSGTPSTAGANSFTVLVTDALNGTDPQALSLTVVGGTLPCGRPQRFQGQEIWTFKRPTTPAVSPPDCVALNDFWIDTSTNPAIVKLVIGTTGGVVTTTSVGTIATSTLLSSSHSDTVAATPSEGTIIVGTEGGKWQALQPGPAGSFLGSDGESVGYFQPAQTTLRGTTVTFHTRTGTAVTTWTNQPSTRAEFLGPTAPTGTNRIPFLINGYTRVMLMVRLQSNAAAGAKMFLEYSTVADGTTWTPIDGEGGTGTEIDINNGGVSGQLVSAQATVAAGLTGIIYLRVAGIGGDGVVDPSFGNIAAVFW